MKKSLLSLLALSAMVLSSCNQDKPTPAPEPVLPYQISASGKAMIENVYVITTENGTTIERALGNAKFDFVNSLDQSILGQFEYKDKKAVVDLGNALITKTISIEEYLKGEDITKAVISNKNAKVAVVDVDVIDIANMYDGRLRVSDASLANRNGFLTSQIIYFTEATDITTSENIKGVLFVYNVKARKGWNNLVARLVAGTENTPVTVNITSNDVPATGVSWLSFDK